MIIAKNNKILFRNDDVNPNSNFKEIREIYSIIKKYFPNSEIYSCVNIFAKETPTGMPYPPTKKLVKDRKLYLIDKIFDLKELEGLEKIVSHGMWHLDHWHSSEDLQTFSIVSSCKLLKTNIFIPPFWRFTKLTKKICEDNKIKLWVEPKWVNFDNQEITRYNRYYIIHSWKFTPESFEKKLLQNIKKLQNEEEQF